MRELLEAAFGEDRPFVDVYDGDTPKVQQYSAQPFVVVRSRVNISCISESDMQDHYARRGVCGKVGPLAHLQYAMIICGRGRRVKANFAQRDQEDICPLKLLSTMVQWERPEIRDSAALLITNPDMLHCSILPVHRTFGRLLAHLRFVVVDEGHAYRCL